MKKYRWFIAGICLAAVFATAACGKKGESTEKMPNPMVKYNSVEEVEQKIGYAPAELSKDTGFSLQECFIITDTLADLRYVRKEDGAEAAIRTQKDADSDITGYQDPAYEDITYGKAAYKLSKMEEEDSFAAYFEQGDMTYSMTANGISRESFQEVFESLISSVN